MSTDDEDFHYWWHEALDAEDADIFEDVHDDPDQFYAEKGYGNPDPEADVR